MAASKSNVRKIFDTTNIPLSTFNYWKYEGMEAFDIKRLKDLEAENRKLKQMYPNLSLEHEVLKDIIEKKL